MVPSIPEVVLLLHNGEPTVLAILRSVSLPMCVYFLPFPDSALLTVSKRRLEEKYLFHPIIGWTQKLIDRTNTSYIFFYFLPIPRPIPLHDYHSLEVHLWIF